MKFKKGIILFLQTKSLGKDPLVRHLSVERERLIIA
jgi:hypothetical protein